MRRHRNPRRRPSDVILCSLLLSCAFKVQEGGGARAAARSSSSVAATCKKQFKKEVALFILYISFLLSCLDEVLL
jgi:hypothetical protein